MKSAIKFVLYNALWFVCAHTALGPYEAYSLILPIVLMALFWRDTQISEKIYYMFLTLLGLTFDLFAQDWGWIDFRSELAKPLPIWLISIWFLFSVVMGDLFRTFKTKKILLFTLGAVFGPLSYSYGEKINILTVTNQTNYLIYSVFWILFLQFGLWGYLKVKSKN